MGVIEVTYNTLDEVLAELDKRWDDHLKGNKNGSKYNLERIPFRGFNFSISAMYSRYRVETLNGGFILNSNSKSGLIASICSILEIHSGLDKVIEP